MALSTSEVKAIQSFLVSKGQLLKQDITGDWNKLTADVYAGYQRSVGVAEHIIRLPILGVEALEKEVVDWVKKEKGEVSDDAQNAVAHATAEVQKKESDVKAVASAAVAKAEAVVDPTLASTPTAPVEAEPVSEEVTTEPVAPADSGTTQENDSAPAK